MTIWTADSLAKAIEGFGAFTTTVVTDTSISVVAKDQDVPFVVAIKGNYMSVEAKLFDDSELSNPAHIQELLLKATDLLELSSFTVREVDGAKVYFILGKLSASTSVENVKLEIETIAEELSEVIAMVIKQNEIDSK
ncbi:DUF2170 family protein [Vibrio coralliirubri]|uniref:DUF2170 family protein n=1 Tax=Vibrio coralliirubri TaxID=1516159 RepID=UPI00228374F2|nr:DUF2170 family protein [Vibrio coralliirubri]MCY9861367.1 DUF2170 family protein [Vibrio coralliirubri]